MPGDIDAGCSSKTGALLPADQEQFRELRFERVEFTRVAFCDLSITENIGRLCTETAEDLIRHGKRRATLHVHEPMDRRVTGARLFRHLHIAPARFLHLRAEKTRELLVQWSRWPRHAGRAWLVVHYQWVVVYA